jgi:enediyne polyketide synthase
VQEGRPDRFALVEAGAVAASFARVLHLEEGLDTCVVGVTGARDLERARSEAEAVHGFREVRFDRRGRRLVPVLRPLDLARGRHPLSTGDVVLATGGGKGITAECALGLVEGRGASLAILGRSDPRADEELAAGLRRLDAAGVRHLYVRADVTDRAAVRAAVERVRAELGPVTAILHGAGVNVPTLLPNLDADAYRDTLRPKLEGLRNLVHTVGLESLRLVVGLGSVIATTGLRGEAHYALANEWLRELLEDLGRRNPRCRCLDVEWSVWSGAGMGERLGTVDALARAGIDAISPADGIPLLEELVSAPALPPTVVATGRIGDLPTVELERVKLPLLRFLERPVVAVPNVELVVEAELSVATDPYVRDHVLDGVQLLPAVVGLEAMAEASATLLGGREPRTFEAVEFARPVTVPADGSRRIRIAALRRRDGAVDVAVRSDETGFQADHFRATCRPVTGRAEWRVDVGEGRAPLEPDDVYDLLLFHGSRFRRLRGYRRLAARSCEADVEVRADARWFGEFLPQRLVLGDLGARDAVVHALQACIPDTRVLPVGVDRLVVRRLPREAAVVSARERADDGETLVWDLDVRDRSGHLCERWEGLKLQRLGGPRQPPRWPRALLVPLLERGIARAAGVPVGVGIAGARPEADVAIAYAVGRPVRVERQPNGRPVVAGKQVSAAHVAGLTLAVAAEVPVACDVEEAASRGEVVWRDLLGRDRFELAGRLAAELGGEFDQSAARVWAAAECARKAGRPTREPLALATQAENGWTLLRAGDLAVATYAARVVDLEAPLAFAVLVGNGR